MSTSQIVLAVVAAVLAFWAIGGYNRVIALDAASQLYLSPSQGAHAEGPAPTSA